MGGIPSNALRGARAERGCRLLPTVNPPLFLHLAVPWFLVSFSNNSQKWQSLVPEDLVIMWWHLFKVLGEYSAPSTRAWSSLDGELFISRRMEGRSYGGRESIVCSRSSRARCYVRRKMREPWFLSKHLFEEPLSSCKWSICLICIYLYYLPR